MESKLNRLPYGIEMDDLKGGFLLCMMIYAIFLMKMLTMSF